MKGTFKKVLAMALAMTMAAGVLTGCGGKDPVADTSASGETVTAGSEAAGTTGTADTFTYAIGGDPGANVNVITTNDRFWSDDGQDDLFTTLHVQCRRHQLVPCDKCGYV